MATTLTYQRVRPDAGDSGSTVFDALETNIALNDAHTHDGITSPALPTSSLAKATVAANGVDRTGGPSLGLYTQTVTLPAGHSPTTSHFVFLLGNQQVMPKWEYVGPTQILLYFPNNTDNLTVVCI
jgi:hypothetical protein